MKTWIMTALLGGVLLSGAWANAGQNDPPAATITVQSGTVDDQSGLVTLSGSSSGVVVVADPAGGDGLPAEKRVIAIQRIGPPPPTVAAPVPMPIPNVGRPLPYRPGQVWISSARATMAGKAEKTAYLGVVTTRATATLRSQLKVKAGLVVESIEPKSSAEIGGLQVHDIIEKCDDQWLINPCAVHRTSPHVLQAGRNGHLDGPPRGREEEDYRQARISARPTPWTTTAMPSTIRRLGALSIRTIRKSLPRASCSVVAAAVAGRCSGSRPVVLGKVPLTSGFVATFGDDKQQLFLTIRDGHQIVTAKDSGGKQIFEGPIDTPEQCGETAAGRGASSSTQWRGSESRFARRLRATTTPCRPGDAPAHAPSLAKS